MISQSDRKAAVSAWTDGLGRTAARCAQLLVCALFLALVLWTMAQLRLVVVPTAIATMVAAATWPIVRRLRALGWPRPVAALAALLLGILVFGMLVWIIVNGIVGEWSELREGAANGVVELLQLMNQILPFDNQRLSDVQRELGSLVSGEETRARAATGAILVAETLTGMVLFVVILFFMLKDGPRIWGFLREALPDDQHERAQRVGERSLDVLGGFIRGTAFVATIDAVIIGIALALLGVPLALPLAVIVFIGAFVPVIGATVAGAFAALIALVTSGPIVALIVVGVVLAVNQLEGDLIAPVVLGSAVSLHPLAILLSLTAGAITAGVIGALLAVPLLAVGWTIITEWDPPTQPEPDEAVTSDG